MLERFRDLIGDAVTAACDAPDAGASDVARAIDDEDLLHDMLEEAHRA